MAHLIGINVVVFGEETVYQSNLLSVLQVLDPIRMGHRKGSLFLQSSSKVANTPALLEKH